MNSHGKVTVLLSNMTDNGGRGNFCQNGFDMAQAQSPAISHLTGTREMPSKIATRVVIARLSSLATARAFAAEADIAEQLRICVHPAVNYAQVPGPVLVVDYRARVDANGNIESLDSRKSSGDAAFDARVATALRQCSPFPPVYTAAGAALYPTVLAITSRSKEE